jgi:NAD-reducing hydrogenase large subunit
LAEQAPAKPFDGADVALVDADGAIDLLGDRLRAVAADHSVVCDAPAGDWDALIAEARPNDPAPRPYLLKLGQEQGCYRVGPVAQLRVGELRTPLAAELQRAWRNGGGDAFSARAIMTLHCVEAIGQLLECPEQGAIQTKAALRGGVGVGWVDGVRGLLVHRYEVSSDLAVAKALILTPTAQNEPWLGKLLRQAADSPAESLTQELEAAIREADPCLPCTAAPAGRMGVSVQNVPARAETSR